MIRLFLSPLPSSSHSNSCTFRLYSLTYFCTFQPLLPTSRLACFRIQNICLFHSLPFFHRHSLFFFFSLSLYTQFLFLPSSTTCFLLLELLPPHMSGFGSSPRLLNNVNDIELGARSNVISRSVSRVGSKFSTRFCSLMNG